MKNYRPLACVSVAAAALLVAVIAPAPEGRIKKLPGGKQLWKALFGNTAAIPEPREHPPAELVREARTARVVLLGDSLTERWNSTGRSAFDRHLTPRKTVALGVGSDRVQHLLWRVRDGELDGCSPEWVALCIGTNNLGTNTPDEIAEGAALVLAEIRARLPAAKVLLLAIPPRTDGAMERFVRPANEALLRLADGAAVAWLDPGPLGTEDGLHFSAEGYERLAAALAVRMN